MNGLGLHLLLELNECNPQLLNDVGFIRQTLLNTAHDVGATVVGESFHRFSPQGVTGILSIAESHISIHTWPEFGYAAADIFAWRAFLPPQGSRRHSCRKAGMPGPGHHRGPQGNGPKSGHPLSCRPSKDMDIPGQWYLETISPDLAMMLRVRKVLYSGETAYQKVEVLDSSVFGRSLVLDGKTQSTELDEHIYHESLVHPAMLLHPGPKSVFIGGGGEGGTLREALAHKSVERVTMLDLDQEVVELCRRYLPQHHGGSFDDTRVSLYHQDAREYLASSSETFDVMVMDLV